MVRLINKNEFSILVMTPNLGEVKPGDVIDVLDKHHIEHFLTVGFEKAPKINSKDGDK